LGATGIGIGSMLGAGVFVVWGPALAVAGHWIVVSVLVAGAVATINAASSAQLAARYPTAGGAYAYGRAELGPAWGFLAGLAFVAGKTASVAAVGLAVGHYTWGAHPEVVATGAIVLSWMVNARGVTRTAAGATVIGALVVVGLLGLVAATWGSGDAGASLTSDGGGRQGGLGILSAAALVFFAFAGYARVATLGEEVREPERTIPRAIAIALVVVGGLYLLVALALVRSTGGAEPGAVPLLDLANTVTWGAALLAVLAPLSAFGALLALTAGVGRTAMAMAQEGDLPRFLARRDAAGVPWLAEGASAAASIVLVWLGGVAFAIAASASAVLVYYAVANIAAARQVRGGRATTVRLPAWLSVVGAVLCVALAAAVPIVASASALGVLAVGIAIRRLVRGARRE
jgi:APA family basic amino acid/polyamine antiporter